MQGPGLLFGSHLASCNYLVTPFHYLSILDESIVISIPISWPRKTTIYGEARKISRHVRGVPHSFHLTGSHFRSQVVLICIAPAIRGPEKTEQTCTFSPSIVIAIIPVVVLTVGRGSMI